MNLLIAAVIAALLISSPALAKDVRVTQDAPACTSWAGWREWVQASLTEKGAQLNTHCPAYIDKGAKVEVIEADDGAGAATVRWRGKEWVTHADRLDE